MSTSKPVAFVIGYGPNVGAAIARKFKSEGFRVAVSAHKLDEGAAKEDGYLGIQADFGDIASVRSAFDRLESELGPSAAVIYNVARRAKAGFEKLPADTPRALIGTGNLQPWITFPFALGMSVGKRGMANIVEASASAYGPQGHRFYFAHEVNSETGGPQVPPTGQAHESGSKQSKVLGRYASPRLVPRTIARQEKSSPEDVKEKLQGTRSN
ncbi:hypothetical protein FRC01_010646, partial [Tulasnella sp. 417]